MDKKVNELRTEIGNTGRLNGFDRLFVELALHTLPGDTFVLKGSTGGDRISYKAVSRQSDNILLTDVFSNDKKIAEIFFDLDENLTGSEIIKWVKQ